MTEVQLVVIGDGPLRSKLESMARELPGRWRFLGTQSQKVVREWMNRAMVFSVRSITVESGASEGFGLAFAEAQAMGLPVVSFATGGIPEAVAHGKTGFLAPEGDMKMLASYILQLLFRQGTLAKVQRRRSEACKGAFRPQKTDEEA